ncbi:MAG: hypothetical protein ACXIT9_02075 [Nitritalea sp.]
MQDITPKRPSESLSTRDLGRIWRRHRRAYLLFCGLALGLAAAVHWLRPKSYRAEALLLVSSAENMGASPNLGSLAALTGFSLPLHPNQNEVPPSLYPKLASETGFLQQLLPLPLPPSPLADFPGGTLETFLQQETQKSWVYRLEQVKKKMGLKTPSKFIFMDSLPVPVSFEKWLVLDHLDQQVNIVYDPQEKSLTLQTRLPDPTYAVLFATRLQRRLQERLIEISALQAKEQLRFTQERLEEARAAFYQAQNKLSLFRVENQNRISPSLTTQLERLENEYSVKLETFSELSKQEEAAKLQVARDTPLFTTLQPPKASTKPIGPGLLLRMSLFLIAAAFLAAGHLFWHTLHFSTGTDETG